MIEDIINIPEDIISWKMFYEILEKDEKLGENLIKRANISCC